MNNKAYNLKLLLSFIATSSVIIALNFFIDPGKIYYNKIIFQEKEDQILKTFNDSKFGIEYEGNERFLKILLAKNLDPKKYDCVAIGSSHIMQLSSVRSEYFKNLCSNVLNLGASGASYEDILVFLGVLHKYDLFPKRVFVGIDPWTLKPNMDIRYKPYKKYLDYMLSKNDISADSLEKSSVLSEGEEYKNLYNLEYTRESFKEFKKKLKNKDNAQAFFKAVNENPIVNLREKAVTLKDGSHLYSKNYHQTNKTDENYNKEPAYNLIGKTIDQKTIDILMKTFKTIKNKSSLSFLLTPYHPNSFKEEHSRFSKYFNDVESAVKKMANELEVSIYGTYDSRVIGCHPTEFYDYMHGKSSCLDKIFKP